MRFRLPKREYQAFIFDCDGTLVDSMPLHHQAWQRALKSHGAEFDFSWPLFVSRAGMGTLETVAALNQQFGLQLDPHALAQTHAANYAELLPQLQPIRSVVAFAEVHRGQPMSVASGSEREFVEGALRICEILDWFRPVLCRQDVTRGKPDPEMFLRCAELMSVPPAECLVFEDGELGLQAAKAAGMGWVAIDGTSRCSE